MDNTERSQQKTACGWEIFLEDAKRKLAKATTTQERREWRDSIRRFERLIRRNVQMPRKIATQ